MLVLLDNGHGSLINGVYQTPGKWIVERQSDNILVRV